VGEAAWDYSRLGVPADLTALPFRAGAFDAALNLVTLEHVRESVLALAEIARTLASGGQLLLVAPHGRGVHSSGPLRAASSTKLPESADRQPANTHGPDD